MKQKIVFSMAIFILALSFVVSASEGQVAIPTSISTREITRVLSQGMEYCPDGTIVESLEDCPDYVDGQQIEAKASNKSSRTGRNPQTGKEIKIAAVSSGGLLESMVNKMDDRELDGLSRRATITIDDKTYHTNVRFNIIELPDIISSSEYRCGVSRDDVIVCQVTPYDGDERSRSLDPELYCWGNNELSRCPDAEIVSRSSLGRMKVSDVTIERASGDNDGHKDDIEILSWSWGSLTTKSSETTDPDSDTVEMRFVWRLPSDPMSSGSGDDTPSETLSFSFGKIEIKYSVDNGGSGGTILVEVPEMRVYQNSLIFTEIFFIELARAEDDSLCGVTNHLLMGGDCDGDYEKYEEYERTNSCPPANCGCTPQGGISCDCGMSNGHCYCMLCLIHDTIDKIPEGIARPPVGADMDGDGWPDYLDDNLMATSYSKADAKKALDGFARAIDNIKSSLERCGDDVCRQVRANADARKRLVESAIADVGNTPPVVSEVRGIVEEDIAALERCRTDVCRDVLSQEKELLRAIDDFVAMASASGDTIWPHDWSKNISEFSYAGENGDGIPSRGPVHRDVALGRGFITDTTGSMGGTVNAVRRARPGEWSEDDRESIGEYVRSLARLEGEDLALSIAYQASNNERVREVRFNQETNEVEVEHDEEVRLLGFIPVQARARTIIDSEMNERTEYPWWSFLARKENKVRFKAGADLSKSVN